MKPEDYVPCVVARRVCGGMEVGVAVVQCRRCTLMMKHDVWWIGPPLGRWVRCNRRMRCCIGLRNAPISAR